MEKTAYAGEGVGTRSIVHRGGPVHGAYGHCGGLCRGTSES